MWAFLSFICFLAFVGSRQAEQAIRMHHRFSAIPQTNA